MIANFAVESVRAVMLITDSAPFGCFLAVAAIESHPNGKPRKSTITEKAETKKPAELKDSDLDKAVGGGAGTPRHNQVKGPNRD